MITALASACTVYTLNIHYRGKCKKHVPKWMKVIFFKIAAKILFVCIKNRVNFKFKFSNNFQMEYHSEKSRNSSTANSNLSKMINNNFESSESNYSVKYTCCAKNYYETISCNNYVPSTLFKASPIINLNDSVIPKKINSIKSKIISIHSSEDANILINNKLNQKNYLTTLVNNVYCSRDLGRDTIIKTINKFCESLENAEIRLKRIEINEQIQNEWTFLSKIVDRLFFCILNVITFFIFADLIYAISI